MTGRFLKNFYSQKTAFIIGGSQGIGLATALELASFGAHVVVASRHSEKLSRASQALEKRRQNARQTLSTASLDVRDEEAARRVFELLLARHGTPDFLINCAGFARPGYLEDSSLDDLRKMMDLNYFGTVHAVKAVLPALRKAGRGHIINVSSMAGYLGLFGYAGYCASKYAVIGFSQALRHELKPYGICVSVLCPPSTRTPGFEEENRLKPPEVLRMEEKAGTVEAQDVARALLRALPGRPFLIHPSLESRLIFRASRFLPQRVLDFLMRRPLL